MRFGAATEFHAGYNMQEYTFLKLISAKAMLFPLVSINIKYQ